MSRQKLLTFAALVAALALTACADVTGPSNDTACPITGGSDCIK
jgi:predicted small secreted protein